jgi:EPS-associated MarR family transcriptional regulator
VNGPSFPARAHADSDLPEPGDDSAMIELMRLIEERPEMNQRELSEAIGISLGKLNYVMRALVDRGWVKTNNFRRSPNKLAYAYVLTPKGLARKVDITRRFLRAKEDEFARLQATIERLRVDLGKPT